jgi:hypothetical protein
MSEGRVERRLAAILAVDVVGCSRLMSTDDEGTLAALRAIRRELGDPKIREHRGRIVKTTGDGLLIEFASVVDAVRCAVEVQREMAIRNAGIPPERRIQFPMGINLGDIIVGMRPMLASVDALTAILIGVGGVLYSIGLAFHIWRTLAFHNAIWHSFVLVAASCNYAAILDGVVLART